MMDCKTFHDRLNDFVEGRLPDETMRLMEAHVQGCKPCALRLKACLAMESAIALERNERINPFASTRILQFIEHRPVKHPRPVYALLRPVAATLALSLALLLGYMIGTLGPGKSLAGPSPETEIQVLKENLNIPHFMDEDLFITNNQ